jgi:hypothetical protein
LVFKQLTAFSFPRLSTEVLLTAAPAGVAAAARRRRGVTPGASAIGGAHRRVIVCRYDADMRRAWDVVVEGLMILGSLVGQFVVIFIIVGLLWAGVQDYFGLKGRWWAWIVEGVAFVALNALSFHEFRRLPAEHRALGLGGSILMLPRGVYRIIHGRETYRAIPDDPPGFPVVAPVDPNRELS